MEIKLEKVNISRDDLMIIKPEGELSSNTAVTFKEHCNNLLDDGHKKFVVDMSGVSLLSSIGIRELLGLFKEAESRGGGVRLCNLPNPIKDILKETGLTQAFKLYLSLEDAIDSFN